MYPAGCPTSPWHFFQPQQLEDLLAVLQARGYSDADLCAILGDNWLRLATEVWK